MFCTKCGAQLPDNSDFCNVCGTKQVAVQPLVSEAPVQPMMQTGMPVQPMMQAGMPVQPMNQGMMYQMNGGGVQNPQGYQPNAYQNPQGYQMSPNMGNNAKKKVNPAVWIVLAVILVAAIGVGVYFLVKDQNKKEAERDAAVNQWEQTVQDAQNAQSGQDMSGNSGYTNNDGYDYNSNNNSYNNSYATTYSDWEAVSDAFVQNYWFEDFDAMVNTFVEPQQDNLRAGMQSYGSEEAYWSAMFSDLYDTCGTDINLNYSTTAEYQLSSSELEEIANVLYNSYYYTCYPTDGYYVCFDFYYEGNLGQYSETEYMYVLEINGSWYVMAQ